MPTVYTQEEIDTKINQLERDISELRRLTAFLTVQFGKPAKERVKKVALLNAYQKHQLQFEHGLSRKCSGVGASTHTMGDIVKVKDSKEDNSKEENSKEENNTQT